MQICNNCLYHEFHPLNITFDDEGICSGCMVHREKDILNWDQRENLLKNILSNYRNKSGKNYDCIIPVDGARDSHFIIHIIKNVYKMNPLLVTYNKHYNTAIGIRNLANLRMKFDCDIISQTISPQTVKKITRATLRRFGSIYWHCLAGKTVFPVQIATRLKIPLIIWGCHQGVDQVGMFSHEDEVEMTRKYRKEHDLMGYEAEDLINDFDEISEQDIRQFKYPDNRELEQVGVRGIYLNNYMRWDTKAQHEKMIELYDYQTAEQTRTFDNYNDVDDWNYSDVHDYIKFIKHGYGKITDHVNREIRFNRISRDQGLDLIRKYSFKKPRHLELFLKWLGITQNGFHYLIDQHRNPIFWQRDENWEWKYKCEIFSNKSSREFNVNETIDFKLTKAKKSSDSKDGYIIIGKGFNN